MSVGNYMKEKIEQFERDHQYKGYLVNSYDPELRRRWKEEESKRNAKWRGIRNNADVMKRIDYFENVVSFVENDVQVGHIEDGFNMSLALYWAIQGLRKMAEGVDPKPWSNTEFTEISQAEVDEIFARLDSITKRMDEANVRRAMQD